MRIFSDAAQPAPREWTIDIDVDVLTSLSESSSACNLLAILDDDDPLAKRFATDPVFAGSLIVEVCKPQLEARNVTPADFRRLLKGDVFRAACNALVFACADFFGSQQRDALHKILTIKREIEAQLTAQIGRDAETVEPKLIAEAFVEVLQTLGGKARDADPKAVSQAVRESLQTKQSASAGSLPAGSESTPAASPSDNSG